MTSPRPDPDAWPTPAEQPPCHHVHVDATAIRVDPIGRRGVVVAAWLVPLLVAAVGVAAGAWLVVAAPTPLPSAIGVVVAAAAIVGAVGVRSLLARQPVHWHLDPDGVHARRPWGAVARVVLIDEVRRAGSDSHRTRAVHFLDGEGRRLVGVGHTTTDREHDLAVLSDLAGRCRAAGWPAATTTWLSPDT